WCRQQTLKPDKVPRNVTNCFFIIPSCGSRDGAGRRPSPKRLHNWSHVKGVRHANLWAVLDGLPVRRRVRVCVYHNRPGEVGEHLGDGYETVAVALEGG